MGTQKATTLCRTNRQAMGKRNIIKGWVDAEGALHLQRPVVPSEGEQSSQRDSSRICPWYWARSPKAFFAASECGCPDGQLSFKFGYKSKGDTKMERQPVTFEIDNGRGTTESYSDRLEKGIDVGIRHEDAIDKMHSDHSPRSSPSPTDAPENDAVGLAKDLLGVFHAASSIAEVLLAAGPIKRWTPEELAEEFRCYLVRYRDRQRDRKDSLCGLLYGFNNELQCGLSKGHSGHCQGSLRK